MGRVGVSTKSVAIGEWKVEEGTKGKGVISVEKSGGREGWIEY